MSDFGNPRDLLDPRRNNVAVFIKAGSERVDQFGALVDEPFSSPKQNRPALLLSGLWINETHFGPLGRDYNRLGVRRIVFLALHERFDVPRCNQLHLMAKLGHLARSEEHTSELQSLMRISYAVFCLKKKI